MKTIAGVVAVFVVWAILVALVEWLFPQKNGQWERMEEMMNDGVQTSLRLLGLGGASIVVVLACVMVFRLI